MGAWGGNFILYTWEIWREAAPWVLLGFAAAAAMKAYLPQGLLARHLGGRGVFPVIKAALLGAPLPLCSCGVLPVASAMRRQGAGRGATAAFLVATPETGLDSVAVTWALMDPLMTLLRPVAAIFTALAAGLATDFMPRRGGESEPPDSVGDCGCRPGTEDSNCGCSFETTDPACDCGSGAASPGTVPGPPGLGELSSGPPPPVAPSPTRLSQGLDFAWNEMLGDIGPWLAGGVLAAALIATIIPAGFMNEIPGGEWASMGFMLLAGAPLYVCATASTPIAAALVAKGLSPGAALVFLLAGPATNAATIAVVARTLGRGATVIYLAAIVLCSLGAGWAANRLYGLLDLTATVAAGGRGGESEVLGTACAVALAALLAARLGLGPARRLMVYILG